MKLGEESVKKNSLCQAIENLKNLNQKTNKRGTWFEKNLLEEEQSENTSIII